MSPPVRIETIEVEVRTCVECGTRESPERSLTRCRVCEDYYCHPHGVLRNFDLVGGYWITAICLPCYRPFYLRFIAFLRVEGIDVPEHFLVGYPWTEEGRRYG